MVANYLVPVEKQILAMVILEIFHRYSVSFTKLFLRDMEVLIKHKP